MRKRSRTSVVRPELPDAKLVRYVQKGVPAHAAERLVVSRDIAEFFERAVAAGASYEGVANSSSASSPAW